MIKRIFLFLIFSAKTINYSYSQELLDFSSTPVGVEAIQDIESLLLSQKIDLANRRKLFSDNLDTNSKKDSLIIREKNGAEYIYPYDMKNASSKAIKRTFKVLSYLEKKSSAAKKLISKLRASPLKTIIQPSYTAHGSFVTFAENRCYSAHAAILVYANTQKMFGGYQEICRFTRIGSPSKVIWKVNTFSSKKLQAVNLAHELYHSYDMVRGVLDHRNVKHPELEIAALREYRAVFFENLMREDLGLKLRLKYSERSEQNMMYKGQHFWF